MSPSHRIPRSPGAHREPQRDLTMAQIISCGLLIAGSQCVVSNFAVFRPVDQLGVTRPVVLGDAATIGAFAVIHGGSEICDGVVVEDHTVVGQPEFGYAVREQHLGAGARTILGRQSVIRAGAIVYAGVQIGERSSVGHQSVVRSHVIVGDDSQLGHTLTIERRSQIGARARCSPGSHITAETVLGDDVFLGAGVRTINDNRLDWQVGGSTAPLTAPRFEDGCRVGSGAVILGGIQIGARALVGAGSVVTRDVTPDTVVYGNPARPQEGS
jgi:acetyltransferase-like isoleucine patch superfamily enzyme